MDEKELQRVILSWVTSDDLIICFCSAGDRTQGLTHASPGLEFILDYIVCLSLCKRISQTCYLTFIGGGRVA